MKSNYSRVVAVYFSATHTTEKVTVAVAKAIAGQMRLPLEQVDITTPEARVVDGVLVSFSEKDIVVLGMPVYIGRVPNLISPFLYEIKGNGAIGVPVVVYGNRAYDDALIELRDIMCKDGFHVAAAGVFVGEHSFSTVLGAGRPDSWDIAEAQCFGRRIANVVTTYEGEFPEMAVPGDPAPYRFFQARSNSGKCIDIRAVKPVTDMELCDNCGLCAEVCSMGAISKEDFSLVPGKCIKCCACVKRCPNGAKSFVDEQFLEHLHTLEEKFSLRRASVETFFAVEE